MYIRFFITLPRIESTFAMYFDANFLFTKARCIFKRSFVSCKVLLKLLFVFCSHRRESKTIRTKLCILFLSSPCQESRTIKQVREWYTHATTNGYACQFHNVYYLYNLALILVHVLFTKMQSETNEYLI